MTRHRSMTPRGPDDGRSTVRTASKSHITALSVADSAPCRHPTALRGAPRRRPARYEWRNTAIDTRGLPIRPPHLMQLDVRRPPNPLHIIDKPVHRVKMRQARANPAPGDVDADDGDGENAPGQSQPRASQLAKRRPTPPNDCPDPTRKRHPAHALRHRSPTADRPRLQSSNIHTTGAARSSMAVWYRMATKPTHVPNCPEDTRFVRVAETPTCQKPHHCQGDGHTVRAALHAKAVRPTRWDARLPTISGDLEPVQ